MTDLAPVSAQAPAVLGDARERWLARRRELVTASDVAAILGHDPRRGPLAVYASKVGAVEDEDNDWMAFGRDVEGAIAKAYTRRTNRPTFDLGAHELAIHPEAPWLASTLDRVTEGSASHPALAEGRGPLECKAVGGMKAAKWEEEPPVEFQIQLQVQAACTGAAWGSLVALIGGLQVVWKDIERNDRFLVAALPVLEAFHLRVQRREPPEETDSLPSTSRAVRALFPGDGETLALDHVTLEAANRLEAARARASDIDDEVAELDNRLRRALAGATFGALPDGTFLVIRPTKRAGYTVEPTTYTTLRRFRPRLRRRT